MDSSAKDEFPTEGRLLGIDYGRKRVGIAVSTPEQTIASPLETFVRRSPQHDAPHLRKVADEYRVVGIVVGLPVHMSGDEGELARQARAFGEWLAEVTGLPVRYWDERFTTATAEAHLFAADLPERRRREILDKLAAQIMLQSFLDAEDRDRAPVSYR